MRKRLLYLICAAVVFGLCAASGAQERDFDIPRADPPPVIDGEMDEVWLLSSVQHMTLDIGEGPHSSPEDTSGCFRLLYDSDYLYALVDVNDSELQCDSPLADGWQDDSVEFYIDGENSKGAQGATDGPVYQYRFDWNPENLDSYNYEYFHRPDSLEGVEYMMAQTPTGYRCEIRWPWETIYGEPKTPTGQLIGVDCFINDDDDGGGREHQVAWHATEGAGWNTPSMWGTAYIEAPLIASSPAPKDGADDVLVPLFQWTPGRTAMFHEVYFGTTPEIGPEQLVAPRGALAMYYHVPGIVPGTTYYWRVDEIEKDGVTVYTGDVWSFLAQPATAYRPDPADGSNTAPLAPDLTWRAGTGAGQHQVYFSESFDDVNDAAAAADKGVVTDPNLAPGDLAELTAYYWRVDEIGAANAVVPGEVWDFTTVAPVEDFESYTDDIDAGEAVFQTWIDGWENATGATVGYLEAANGTFGETSFVHGGGQSMPLDYNNVDSPYYSETSRTFASPLNWTANGVTELVLYVRGKPSNDPNQLYVAVKDAFNGIGVVAHPDAAVVKASKWIEWKIALSAFADAGVRLDSVKELYIGVGDRTNPTPGGKGLVYVDDIGLAKPSPEPVE